MMTQSSLENALHGIVAVPVTPYVHGTEHVDEDLCSVITSRLDSAGIPAVTALGNTAEVHQLDEEEKLSVLRGVAAGREGAALIAGLDGSSISVLRRAEVAHSLGYDAVMLHEPADPFGDSAGLFSYYQQLSDRVPLPVILYLRSTRIGSAELRELVEHPLVVGVKFARPDLATLADILKESASTTCIWINGLAESSVPAFSGLGVLGFTSGIAVARPDAALAVHQALVQGDLPLLQRLLDLIGPVEELRNKNRNRNNVSVLKEMLRMSGIDTGGVRPPHSPLNTSDLRLLHAALRSWQEDMRNIEVSS